MSKYDDIINMEHPRSATRPHMSMHDRAAQFAPFAALTGHGALISETARLTDERVALDDCAIEELNGKLCEIAAEQGRKKKYKITYFVADERKAGGAYKTVSDTVKAIDTYTRTVITSGGLSIPIDDVTAISGA